MPGLEQESQSSALSSEFDSEFVPRAPGDRDATSCHIDKGCWSLGVSEFAYEIKALEPSLVQAGYLVHGALS